MNMTTNQRKRMLTQDRVEGASPGLALGDALGALARLEAHEHIRVLAQTLHHNIASGKRPRPAA